MVMPARYKKNIEPYFAPQFNEKFRTFEPDFDRFTLFYG